MEVVGNRTYPRATGDCPTCGEVGPHHTIDIEAARRWCVAHVRKNPDHRAHLETQHIRVYRAAD